jgi:acetyl esterase/lipase
MKRFVFAALVSLAWFSSSALSAQDKPTYTRTEDVIYGRKFGTALTLDVFEPAKKNGAAVFWVVSSGFVSSHDSIAPGAYQPLLERGYTVFAVVHGSQPRFLVPEFQEDVHRAVRFVRLHAARWGVDPQRFGVSGASAGGHLSLTIGTQGGPGKPDAKDPVDRQSSAVQAVACFFPPTDFLNWSKPGEPRVLPPDVVPAFGPKWTTPEGQREFGRETSPIYYLTDKLPPTLVIHGDADVRVPLYQSQRFEQRCKELGVPFKLIVKPGAGHGYNGWQNDIALLADWFDAHLTAPKPK